MRMPITKELVDFVKDSGLTAKEIRRRSGMSLYCYYRILRMRSDFLSAENSHMLCKALRISEGELLRIATGVSDGQPAGQFIPPELRPLMEAWSYLCDLQKAKITAYVEGILDASKNTTNKKTKAV